MHSAIFAGPLNFKGQTLFAPLWEDRQFTPQPSPYLHPFLPTGYCSQCLFQCVYECTSAQMPSVCVCVLLNQFELSHVPQDSL